MSLIDQTYFHQRLLSIPQLSDAANAKRLTDYIDMHENDYLDKALGYGMRRDFLAGIGDGGKWDDLLNGAEFTDCNGNIQQWIGFNNAIKESPIAYYVYFNKVREGDIMLSTTGNVKSKTQNSNRLTGMVNLVIAYNYMVKYSRSLEQFILANESDYPSYNPTDTLTETINYYGI